MFFYEPLSATTIVSVLLLSRVPHRHERAVAPEQMGWRGFFIALPLVLTIFVWPHTAVEGTPLTWFQWVKTYSCLAGAILGWLIVYFPAFQKKYIVYIPPIIFAINILEACIRDFQLTGVNGIVDGYLVVGGPWNVMNGIAGILNAVCICGFFGIIVSRGKKKDYVWPDQLWFWIIGYDLWNFAYTYNSVSDRSMYCGLILLAACTIPAFFIKRGAYAQHRVRTLAFNMIITMYHPLVLSAPCVRRALDQQPCSAYDHIRHRASLQHPACSPTRPTPSSVRSATPSKPSFTSTTRNSSESTSRASTCPQVRSRPRLTASSRKATPPHGTRRDAAACSNLSPTSRPNPAHPQAIAGRSRS